MKIRRFWWIAVIAGVAALLGAWLAIPVLAAPFRQADGAAPDAYAAMHETCEAGDTQEMTDAMDSLTTEEWQSMEEHMADDHHASMGDMTGGDWQAMEEHVGDGHHETMNGPVSDGGHMDGGMMGGMMGW